jgi:hypothetical protein
MLIGKIVKSDSHINYVCQISGTHEVDREPVPADYAFGRFVRIMIRSAQNDDPDLALEYALDIKQEPVTYAVGVIYDTILVNPAFGTLGPRLSNKTQVELFSPDYISEKAVLTYIMLLGTMEQRQNSDGTTSLLSVTHGIPPLSLELGSDVETMDNTGVRAFHLFRVDGADSATEPSLHLGYLPHVITQRNSLLPMVTLHIIDQLERLFPPNRSLLSIVKRNFAWRLKVETAG